MLEIQIAIYLYTLIGVCQSNINVTSFHCRRSYQTRTQLERETSPNIEEYPSLIFKIGLKDYDVRIVVRSKKIGVINSDTQFYLFEKNARFWDFKENHLNLVEGFIDSKRNSSYVTGYLKNMSFYGTLYMFDKTLYVEEIDEGMKEGINNAVVREYSHDVYQPLEDSILHSNMYSETKKAKRSFDDTYSAFRAIIGKGKICTLFVVADNSFLRLVHLNDMHSVSNHVFRTIEEANSLFRSTDFDGDGIPDNIGFLVKYFTIITSESSPMNLLPKYQHEPIDGKTYLMMFSRYELLKNVCLGLAFTGQTFKNGTIGISFTALPSDKSNFFQFPLGGICDQPLMVFPRRSLNALSISTRLQNGKKIPQYILELSLAHELGHSFGSNHDTQPECEGYLMTEHTPVDNKRNHFVFSKCSKRMVVETIINQGFCLLDGNTEYCGNGIIENGETCDCGTIRDCWYLDPCCQPRGHPKACHLKMGSNYQCHPAQGMCCSPKCVYNDLSQYDLDCHHFEKSCPCRLGDSQCPCGVEGKCIGGICSSEECTRINLTECECPPDEEDKSCRTCCLYNKTCMDSLTLSAQIISTDFRLFYHQQMLRKDGNRNKSLQYGLYERFCKIPENVPCIDLYFRQVKTGEYCLLHGQVGICSSKFNCEVPRIMRGVKIPRTLRNSADMRIQETISHLILISIYLMFLIFSNRNHVNI